jgi:predicted protein tyrosine phosphatase
MIKNIVHAGVLHVNDIRESFQDSTPVLLISILDLYTPFDRPNLKKFHNSLSLTFKDRCEEDYGHDNSWPDEPSDAWNRYILRVCNERLFSLSDAVKIVDFVERYQAKTEEYNLIAHCKSGVGRSAAVAEFFGITHNIPYKGTDPKGRFMPNCRMTRLLTKAYFSKYKHADSRNRNTNLYELGIPQHYYLTSGL